MSWGAVLLGLGGIFGGGIMSFLTARLTNKTDLQKVTDNREQQAAERADNLNVLMADRALDEAERLSWRVDVLTLHSEWQDVRIEQLVGVIKGAGLPVPTPPPRPPDPPKPTTRVTPQQMRDAADGR